MFFNTNLQIGLNLFFFTGTKEYCPPEYDFIGKYHGEPATVWSLGILMFTLLRGQFPEPEDLDDLNDNNWAKDGLSQGTILISAKDTYNFKSYT